MQKNGSRSTDLSRSKFYRARQVQPENSGFKKTTTAIFRPQKIFYLEAFPNSKQGV
jgi:hypothetical protein